MEIVKLKAPIKDNLWGGTRLRDLFGKESDGDILAEAWELSAHNDGISEIVSGEFAGKNFQEYLSAKGQAIIGSKWSGEGFPILVKFIDAQNPLSIQVHPQDDYAKKFENDNGKTEMWYVIDAEEGSFLYYGLRREVSKEEFRRAIEEGTLEDILFKVYPKAGDVFLLESGSIHAIGAGLLICEIQQSSNVTYRVYDYMRKDKNGNLRELHIDKALDVSNLKPLARKKFDSINHINPRLKRLAKCDYFDALKGELNEENNSEKYIVSRESFQSLTFIKGTGQIKTDSNEVIDVKAGETYFVGAQDASYEISGNCEFILATL